MGFFSRNRDKKKDEPEPAEQEVPEEPPVEEQEAGEMTEQVKEQAQERNEPYFVSPHPDGGWQVKKAKAKKALKRFDTKKEAEAYAKQVAKNQGTGVVRQKKDGKIQKKR